MNDSFIPWRLIAATDLQVKIIFPLHAVGLLRVYHIWQVLTKQAPPSTNPCNDLVPDLHSDNVAQPLNV